MSLSGLYISLPYVQYTHGNGWRLDSDNFGQRCPLASWGVSSTAASMVSATCWWYSSICAADKANGLEASRLASHICVFMLLSNSVFTKVMGARVEGHPLLEPAGHRRDIALKVRVAAEGGVL